MGAKPEMNRRRRTTGAMTAARFRVITTTPGATGKSVHVAASISSAAIAYLKILKKKRQFKL
jgi:hypothetical protein